MKRLRRLGLSLALDDSPKSPNYRQPSTRTRSSRQVHWVMGRASNRRSEPLLSLSIGLSESALNSLSSLVAGLRSTHYTSFSSSSSGDRRSSHLHSPSSSLRISSESSRFATTSTETSASSISIRFRNLISWNVSKTRRIC